MINVEIVGVTSKLHRKSCTAQGFLHYLRRTERGKITVF